MAAESFDIKSFPAVDDFLCVVVVIYVNAITGKVKVAQNGFQQLDYERS